jgi:hypothetical protein
LNKDVQRSTRGTIATILKDLMSGPDETDASLAGQTAGYKVNLPVEIDVMCIRKRLKITQARFSDTSGFSLEASNPPEKAMPTFWPMGRDSRITDMLGNL